MEFPGKQHKPTAESGKKNNQLQNKMSHRESERERERESEGCFEDCFTFLVSERITKTHSILLLYSASTLLGYPDDKSNRFSLMSKPKWKLFPRPKPLKQKTKTMRDRE